jgi:hypothetical protein
VGLNLADKIHQDGNMSAYVEFRLVDGNLTAQCAPLANMKATAEGTAGPVDSDREYRRIHPNTLALSAPQTGKSYKPVRIINGDLQPLDSLIR